MREKSSTLGSRHPLSASERLALRTRQRLQSHLALPIILDKVERKVSGSKRSERPPSILGSIFGPPKAQEAKPERQ
jgi:hypothetical protein